MYHLHNYKGFADAQIDLFKPFSLLIGPNGSGKSNVIEAIELLSFVARGQPLYEIGDIGRGSNALAVRGGLQACGRGGDDGFQLGFSGSILFKGAQRPFRYDVEIGTRPHPQIIGETLNIGDRTLYEALPKQPDSTSHDLTVSYDNFARGGRKPNARVSSDRSVLSQYREFAALRNREYSDCLQVVQSLMSHLQASFVFDPEPKLMHNYERVGDSILKRDGSNLSAVLHGLSTGDDDQRAILQRLLKKIRQLPDEPYKKFDFTLTELRDVIFGFQESSGYKVDARVLSDGTLRTLAILTAFETVAEGSRIIIEEFDNGLHPSRVGILCEAISQVANDRRLNVLVTTHNPATMNFLSPEQLAGVVICTWDDDKKSASLVRLDELPRYDEFVERGPFGDLVTRRVVEQYLSPAFEEQRQKKVLNWLESLS